MDVVIGPFPEDISEKRKIMVNIDPYDVWDVADTLSYIIHPLLVEYKSRSISAGFVDEKDLPDYLLKDRQFDDNNMSLKFNEEWWWVVDEMIWVFEMMSSHDPSIDRDGTHLLYDDEGKKIKNGRANFDAFIARRDNALRLFGKYFLGLWD